MPIINFITDTNDKIIKEELDILKTSLNKIYSDYESYEQHYLNYVCKEAHINIFYNYINLGLLEKSNYNIFIYDNICFSNNWKNLLNKFDMIITKFNEDYEILKKFITHNNIKLLDKELYKIDKNKFIINVINCFRKIPLSLPKEKNIDYPNISICTITYNRSKFLPLMLLNINNTNYPKNKIEWIIIDDSANDKLKELLPKDLNIKYIKLKNKTNIGEKRNLSIQNASNEIILIMDDDDYYPAESFTNRVNKLLNENVDIVFSTIIPCFDINKYISYINVPDINENIKNRISEATLCFKKSYWKNNKFNNKSKKNEGYDIINDKTNFCEINSQNIIISLSHKNNSTNRKVPKTDSNGSHYNLTNEIFELITNLDNK